MNDLSKSALSVQKALAEFDLDLNVVELTSSTRTAQDAANSIGCSVEQIIKSLIFKTQNTSEPILILASGPTRVNEKLIESIIGQKIEKPNAEYVKEITGFAIGGIPPVGHKNKIKTFIDEDLMKYEELWAAAGTPFAVFNINPKNLLKITDGILIKIHE
jgi:prolyl-tRNA editing enzyme YbaK/EbsC (Cys-tRNA(Pro) deacylase)